VQARRCGPVSSHPLESLNVKLPAPHVVGRLLDALAPDRIAIALAANGAFPLLLPLLEISQIRGRLALSGGRQKAVPPSHIILVSDAYELLALFTDVFNPSRARIGVAAVGLVHRPGTR